MHALVGISSQVLGLHSCQVLLAFSGNTSYLGCPVLSLALESAPAGSRALRARLGGIRLATNIALES